MNELWTEDLPKIKMDHRSLCRYAINQGKSIKELTKEEVYQYVDWSLDPEFEAWRNEKYANWDTMSKLEQIIAFERWIDERERR